MLSSMAYKLERLFACDDRVKPRTLRNQDGFTLTEVLATVIIVGLVSMMMAGGIMLANKQFVSSMAHSQAQQLYTTIAETIDSDLRYVGNTTSDFAVDASGVHYKSEKHGDETLADSNYLYLKTLDDKGNVQSMDTYGQLALCTADGTTKNRLLGKGFYNNGLVVKISSLEYNETIDCFVVTMSVAQKNDTAHPIIDAKRFTIKALNYNGGQ